MPEVPLRRQPYAVSVSTVPALVLEGVTLSRAGRPILQGLSLGATFGEITALLGPNGAGKTTTIRCCTGLLRPDAGRIEVLGHAPGAARASSQIGFMPQTTGAWSGIRAGELLHYLGGLYARPHSPAELIDALGIGEFAGTPYRRLSGGQQQLVNLAGALVGRPRLVFLDEPTAGLDPHVRRATWEVIRSLRTAGVAVLLTTHDMDEAAALADRVWIMDRGRIAISGTIAELTSSMSLEDVFLAHTHRTGA
jgi:ABC-2 type transport system ATP-binding protein